MQYVLYSALHDDVCAICSSHEEATKAMQEYCRLNNVVEREMGIVLVESNTMFSLRNVLDEQYDSEE